MQSADHLEPIHRHGKAPWIVWWIQGWGLGNKTAAHAIFDDIAVRIVCNVGSAFLGFHDL